jgi:hypothetical protein
MRHRSELQSALSSPRGDDREMSPTRHDHRERSP